MIKIQKNRSLGYTGEQDTALRTQLNKKDVYVIETPPSMVVYKQWFQFISYAEAIKIKIENPELNIRLATTEEKEHLGAVEVQETSIWDKIKSGAA